MLVKLHIVGECIKSYKLWKIVTGKTKNFLILSCHNTSDTKCVVFAHYQKILKLSKRQISNKTTPFQAPIASPSLLPVLLINWVNVKRISYNPNLSSD
jgi:hypothetical protein